MKRAILSVLVICLIMFILYNSNKTVDNPGLIEYLPEFKAGESYRGKGFQDYTQYCKYHYYEDVIKYIDKEQTMFSVTKEEEVDIIVNYFENFRMWIENEDFNDKYDWNPECVTIGDYFYIANHYQDKEVEYNPEMYPSYSVYWFDRETLTMWYIHNGV